MGFDNQPASWQKSFLMEHTDARMALLDCAQDLIQCVGVNPMSYNDLSREVGIRKASIHYRFLKKEDLIRELQVRCQWACGEHYLEVVAAPGKTTGGANLHRLGESK